MSPPPPRPPPPPAGGREPPPGAGRGPRRYQDIRSASFLDWHPRGGMLVQSRIGKLTQLYHVAEPGAAPVALTSGDEPVDSGRYLPDGSLVFSRGKGGDENFQI